jgi:hypothetical protein
MCIVGIHPRIVGRDIRLRLGFVVEGVWSGDEDGVGVGRDVTILLSHDLESIIAITLYSLVPWFGLSY